MEFIKALFNAVGITFFIRVGLVISVALAAGFICRKSDEKFARDLANKILEE